MATVDKNVSSTISSDAVRMLSCFVSGLDTVVYEIAEEIARTRTGHVDECSGPVEIEAQDVKQAAETVAQYFKNLVSDGALPAELIAHIDQMLNCCRLNAPESL